MGWTSWSMPSLMPTRTISPIRTSKRAVKDFIWPWISAAIRLWALARHAAQLMEGRQGAILTMTYMGSEKVIPNYNVMGVAKAALEASVKYLAYDLGPKGTRINAISAGPIRTLAASGISGFKEMLHHCSERAPLKRNIDQDEVGRTALYLLSDMASAVTGEVLHVDAGYNIMGM